MKRKRKHFIKAPIIVNGTKRYYDKPYNTELPRPLSPEYLAFRKELREAK